MFFIFSLFKFLDILFFLSTAGLAILILLSETVWSNYRPAGHMWSATAFYIKPFRKIVQIWNLLKSMWGCIWIKCNFTRAIPFLCTIFFYKFMLWSNHKVNGRVDWFKSVIKNQISDLNQALMFLYACNESVDCHLLSSFCDISNLHISPFKYVLSTMGVSKESISKFLIGNRFHVKLRILSPYSNRIEFYLNKDF